MGPGAGSIRRRAVLAGMTTAWPGQAAHRVYSNVQLSVPVVRATGTEEQSKNGSSSAGKVAGIVVGCVAGGALLLLLLGLLLRCLCQRRKVSANQEKPGSGFPSETKARRGSGWNCWCLGKRGAASKARAPPPVFGSDRMEAEDFSDTSFVLPELGGPNPHNKFDGMEWVDIKGMDHDVLVDISSDLRKYQPPQQRP